MQLKFVMLGLNFLIFSFVLKAQKIDTLDARHQFIEMQHLHPGLRKYLVYSEDSVSRKRLGVFIWERNILPFKTDAKSIIIKRKWYSYDSQYLVRTIESVVDASTFLPILHHSAATAMHRPAFVEHYLFTPDSVYTAPIISQKKFQLSLQQSVYNWELDLETFALFPLRKEKKFAIYFYPPESATLPKCCEHSVE